MLKIGVTGGIGAGKSVVTKIFSILGAPVYDADTRAKYLMQNDAALAQDIKRSFGEESFLPDGNLNKPYLSAAFSDPDKLSKLNSLVHPVVGKDFRDWAEKNQDFQYVIKEAALMFESGSYKLLDKVITVYCPEELRIERVLQRDSNRSPEQVKRIIEKQMPEAEKLKKADFVIFNDEEHLLVPQVIKILESIL